MIRSMTGYGSAEGAVAGARTTVELRSVNHRFFNPSLKLPSSLARWENDVRDALRKRVGRGHVTLFARVESAATAGVTIDEVRLAAYVARLRALQRDHGLDGPLDLATVLRLPDVIASRLDDELPAEAGPELLAIVDSAANSLLAMRAAEGERLSAYLRERIGLIEAALGRIEARAPQRVVEQRDRLRRAVQELTQGIAVDDQRLAMEIALLSDRLDVQEELARFRSHVTAFREALASEEPDGVGKRLGFLLQEMLREANTTGSKANDTVMTRDVLIVKEELERIREQVENLE